MVSTPRRAGAPADIGLTAAATPGDRAAVRRSARARRVNALRERFGWTDTSSGGPGAALVLIAGLPGTGKSHLAAALAARFPVVVLRSDEVRKALYPVPRYTRGESGVVYLTCYALLETLLTDGYAVVFDATNLKRRGRKRARALAETAGAPSLVVVTVSPPEVVAQRLRQRSAGESAAYSSDADLLVHERLAGTMESVDEPALVVDTSVSLEPAVEAVSALLERPALKEVEAT